MHTYTALRPVPTHTATLPPPPCRPPFHLLLHALTPLPYLLLTSFVRPQVFRSVYAHILSHWGLVQPGSPLDLSLAVAGLGLYSAYFIAISVRMKCMPL